ncbi:hypothetical protein [Natronococcus occultus]|uniref:Uncharacterized protein n=1 Tax=Natronococcus occultus SP4 TaxID=694430 RepID=L0K0P3_9EURY|nr:hypothetical protein [Natronococcus occultus]AGB38130.1 hypothetical protein Natoc_2354 [Natronococcus occultus SP4]
MSEDPLTRRRTLVGAGSIAILGTAGCLEDDESDDEPADGESADAFDDDLVDDPADDTDHEVDISELLVYERDGEQLANSHAGHWHYETRTGGLPVVEPGSTLDLETRFTKDGEDVAVGDGEPYQPGLEIADGEPEGVVDIDVGPTLLSLSGAETGETAVVFQLLEDGEAVWEAPPIDAFVES